MGDLNESNESGLETTDSASYDVSLSPYITRSNANVYFSQKLGTIPWDSATAIDQEKALIQATRMIDRLVFAGTKSESDQRRQFPRGGDVEIPKAIQYATCELALQLLNGVEIEGEVTDLTVTSHKFGPVTTTFDRKNIPLHIQCGIPSYEAWLYLQPYLKLTGSVSLVRVN